MVFSVKDHDSEILSLQYSCASHNEPILLATGSRDRLIQLYEYKPISKESPLYAIKKTLDDNTSSVVALRFTETDNSCKLISCGADKVLLCRTLKSENGELYVKSYHKEVVTV